MSPSGEPDLLARTRSALLDALEALAEHRDAVVVIGAQAVYLRTGRIAVALPETTKDSDLAIDPRALGDRPLVEDAMRGAGFAPAGEKAQPGTWVNAAGIPVDLMVPATLSGAGGRRGARVPPHSRLAMRRAAGLEAAVIDRSRMRIGSLTAAEVRAVDAWVAGPAALLVSKLHKLAEREGDPDRLADKDAHDVYRLLVAVPLAELVRTFEWLRNDAVAEEATNVGLAALERLFAAGPMALGSRMAGRAEAGIGAPEVVAASAATLASDLVVELRRR